LSQLLQIEYLNDIVYREKPLSKLRSVTYHMGPYSFTCHPTKVNAPCLSPNHVSLGKLSLVQFSSKFIVCVFIPRLHDRAKIEQTSSWLVQLTYSSSSSQLDRVNGVLHYEADLEYEYS